MRFIRMWLVPALATHLGIAMAFGAERQASGGEFPRPFLTVELYDGTGLSETVLEWAKAETSAIFSHAGIELMWLGGRAIRRESKDQSKEARLYIRWLLPRPCGDQGTALACVLKDIEGVPGPVVYVSRRRIERFMNLGRQSGHSAWMPPVFARALGRVMAHELSHRFLQSSCHTRKGILKEGLSREDLTGILAKGFTFTEEQAEILQVQASTVVLTEFP